MEYDFSFVKESSAIMPIALKTVYVLHADRTYDVKKDFKMDHTLIALRTIEGLGKIKIDSQEEMALTPNTLLFINHHEVRTYSCVGNVWDFWWFEFSVNDMHHLPMNTLLHIGRVANELADCQSCLELLRKNDPGSTALASATLNTLIYKWLLHFQSELSPNPYKEAVKKTVEYSRANLGNDISIKELANIAGLCERRFRQVFINITGMPPKKYIDGMRIRTAEELLKNTPFSIYDISQKLGYSSQFHFCRAFEKYHGVPPSQFRKE
jgi:AraC-like DNA-binding protein